MGEAALLFMSRVWSWQLGEGFPAATGPQASRSSICGELLGRETLESVSPGLGASVSTKEELGLCAFSHAGRNTLSSASTPELGNSSRAIYKASCSRCDRWAQTPAGGDPFCFKCQILTAKEPMAALLHVHRKSYTQQPKLLHSTS